MINVKNKQPTAAERDSNSDPVYPPAVRLQAAVPAGTEKNTPGFAGVLVN